MRNLMAFGLALGGLTAANAAVTVVSGSVDVSATSTSGKLGSSSGVITDDPAAVTGTSGVLSTLATTIAGPVPPGDLPTTPGTDGVATAIADGEVDFSQPSTFATDLALDVTFVDMDGGVYSANAGGEFSIDFTVPVDTTYVATGSYQVASNDVTWRYQLSGPGGFLLNSATTSDDAGSINFAGTLTANTTYTLSGRCTIQQLENSGNPGSAATSAFVSATFLVGPTCGNGCDVAGGDADVDDDCDVDLSDLASVLGNFGVASAAHADGDTDFDGDVDLTDLANVLSLFGTSCP